MNIGTKIKMCLVESNKTQKWLSDKTGISYEKLNASLNGSRALTFDELANILWATGKTASDFISPSPPKQAS